MRALWLDSRRPAGLALLVCLAGGAIGLTAASPAPAVVPDSGVSGRVHIGPTCPVERIPPDPACADRPHVATIDFRRPATHRLVRSVRSDVHGRFTARLAPGLYVMQPRPGPGIARPLQPRRTVRVLAHRFTAVRIEYDSGIRFVDGRLR